MFKKFIAAFAALIAATAFAAVDVNKATQPELEAIKGIGPVISASIVDERKKASFKDWHDLVSRIKGVGDRSAAKFSEGGLTVNGQAYAGAPATPEKTSVGAKAKEVASKTGSAIKSGATAAAAGVKHAGTVVKENAVEEKDAAKQSLADAKAKSADKKAEKKAEKAKMKAEKAAAASAPKK
ncbi:MAG: helix-hairpin-helix domain-containing protein [Caldimonas sp.]